MDPITAKLMSAAGAAADPVYVDDVFSTFLYDGTGSAQTINNGIDLSGEGGLVWAKSRSTRNHILSDTERGTGKVLFSNSTSGEDADATTITSYNSNGFTMGSSTLKMNTNGEKFVSWTFRKAPKFFDVVTYTGNGSHRDISHSLGSEPGSIWIKRTDQAESWIVYHRSLDQGGGSGGTAHMAGLELESSGGQYGGALRWSASGGGEDHTATTFHVSGNSAINGNGMTYVAYIFAHDDQSFGKNGDESIIKCGGYTCDSSGVASIDLGFEPQWVLIKKTTGTKDWVLVDNMRRWTATTGCNGVYPNQSSAEGSFDFVLKLNSNGFEPFSSGLTQDPNASYIYIAIRRPNKPPETAAECFDVFSQAGSNSTQLRPGTAGSSVTDMAIIKNRTSAGYDWKVGARITGPNTLETNTSDAQSTGTFGTSVNVWDHMSGTELNYDGDINRNGDNYINYHFARKPGFFDVVTYTGTGSTKTESHNLGVAPEMMWVKRRSGSVNWAVYYGDNTDYLILNSNSASIDNNELWNDTSPTASVFTVGPDNDVNANTETYIAYLFATLPGISKVGSYTGAESSINVDCGFANGARFVMIKRLSSGWSGNWWVFDTARGLGSGNDPALYLNATSAEYSSDRLAALSSGFTVGTGDFELNQSGKNYIFLAIA